MISKFFIERPVLSNVIAVLMILIGGVALFNLAIAQYPDVVPPTVQVTTRYPGASAKTVIDTVALPIEQQVNGVEDMIYMQSYSGADGTYSLTVTFKIGTDLNFAQVLVQNRVSSALAQLPQSVQNQGVTVQKKSTSILLFVTLTSPDAKYDSLYLSNYATLNLKDELSRLPGVGNVTVFGAGQYSMRVWLDPNKLQARALMPQDVVQAIQQQSQQVTAGQVGMPPTPPGQAFQITLNVNGRLDDAKQFEDIIVKTGSNGDVTRVRDVGSVELGAQTYSQIFSLNKQPATGIGVFQSPGANALQVEQAVEKKMAELAKAFPPGIKYDTPFDTTKFVTASINEVYKTLIEAGLLVLVVILVFLQDWRAMLVPATTVPVTIIGAFAAMAALGFTINLSTLFAIVLAIGIVVDDAIVVVEGAAHNIEQGMSGHDAAIKAMDALFAPIVGITLVLISVFLPASFLPGLTGRIYAQFALVIAATALLSAVNAATLKPTQCALWLRPPVPPEKRNFFYRGFNNVYNRLERRLRPRGRLARAPCQRLGRRSADPDRDRRLWALAGADRLPADRGPGLSDRRGATARRRGARPHTEGARQGQRDRRQGARRRAGHHHRRHLRARQQRKPRQRRRRLHHPEGLGLARARRGFALAGLRAQRQGLHHHGGADAGAAAAADPGHRQRRRLCHAGRTARRQQRLCQAAGDHRRDGEKRAEPERPAARAIAVPRHRAAIRRRDRSRQDPDPAGYHRPGVLGAVGPISARPMSTSSTSSAACSRSTPRPNPDHAADAARHRRT